MSSRLERLISLDAYIRSGVLPGIEQLCRLFEVQPRTIYQDLKELKEKFGLDIRFDRSQMGYYNASPDKRLPSIAITADEALLLVVASEMLIRHAGQSFRVGLANAINNVVNDKDQDLYARVRGKIELGETAQDLSISIFTCLLRACLKEQPVQIEYMEPDSELIDAKLVLPKEITHHSQWKFRGIMVETGEPCEFLLERIVDCEFISGDGDDPEEQADQADSPDQADEPELNGQDDQPADGEANW